MNKYLIIVVFLLLSIPAKTQPVPINTKLMVTYDSLNTAWDIIIKDQYAFILEHNSKIVVLNIEDPFHPFKVATIDSFMNLSSIQIFDTLLFAGGQEGGFLNGVSTYNISDPTKPTFLSFYQTQAEVMSIVYKNNFLFLATTGGIMSLNISNPINPIYSDFLLLPAQPWTLEIHNNYVFALSQNSGLFVVDISLPDSLTLVNFINTTWYGSDLFIKNDLLFVAATTIEIYNIVDIDNINFIGSFTLYFGWQPTGIYVDDTFAYISSKGTDGCRILDVTNPAAPVEVGIYPGNCEGIDVVKNKIYLPTWDGFKIVGLMPIVLSPNGGENWDMGNDKVIKWMEEGIDSVDISYSTDGGLNWLEIIANYNETELFYNWVIPSTPSNNCKVKISDSSDPFFSDSSDGLFKIKKLSLLKPNDKDTLFRGSTYQIKWMADSSISQIDLDLSTDGGSTWYTTISGPQNASNGIYNWTVPNFLSNNCLIQIREIGGQVYDISDSTFIIIAPTDLEDQGLLKIFSFELGQNFPNPFNPITKIKYSVPQSSIVTIKVFDVLGNEIETLVNEEKPAGDYEVEFDARNLSSGVYFYKMQSGGITDTKKFILLR